MQSNFNDHRSSLSVDVDRTKCVGCYLCVEACPEEVLGFERSEAKAKVVAINNCICCRNCENSCNVNAIMVNYPEFLGLPRDRIVTML